MKKLLSTALAGAIVLSGGNITTVFADDVRSGTYGFLKYEIRSADIDYDGTDEDYIAITGCDESATEVIIPEEIEGLPIETMDWGTFTECTSLELIDFPSNMRYIDYGIAENCVNLKQVIIRGAEVIGFYAFSGCSNLESIYIPVSTMAVAIDNYPTDVIGDGTPFNACDSLKDVYYEGSEEEWNQVQKFYFIGTGPESYKFDDSVTMHYNSPAPPRADTTEETESLKGDANGDNSVTIADAVAILQYLANPDEYPLSEQCAKNADVLGDDGINTEDALQIQKLDAGVIDKL